jgi:hypothetical protein
MYSVAELKVPYHDRSVVRNNVCPLVRIDVEVTVTFDDAPPEERKVR